MFRANKSVVDGTRSVVTEGKLLFIIHCGAVQTMRRSAMGMETEKV